MINRKSRRALCVSEKPARTHDPRDDFEHRSLPADDPLRPHVLYRLTRPQHGPFVVLYCTGTRLCTPPCEVHKQAWLSVHGLACEHDSWWRRAVRRVTIGPLEDECRLVAMPPDLELVFMHVAVMKPTERTHVGEFVCPTILAFTNMVNIGPPRRTVTAAMTTVLISRHDRPTIPGRYLRCWCAHIKRRAIGTQPHTRRHAVTKQHVTRERRQAHHLR